MNGFETMTPLSLALFWLVAAVILFVIEALTVNLVCIWFACGALLAMITAFFGVPFYAQLPIFLIASVAVLFAWRPWLKKKIVPKKTATNADMVIGQTGIVLEAIDNVAEAGRVSAGGLSWSARSADGSAIPAQETIVVKSIDGVKLIVEPYIPKEGETV